MECVRRSRACSLKVCRAKAIGKGGRWSGVHGRRGCGRTPALLTDEVCPKCQRRKFQQWCINAPKPPGSASKSCRWLQVVPLWPITLKSQLNASTRKLAFNVRGASDRGRGNRHEGYSPAAHQPYRAPSYGQSRSVTVSYGGDTTPQVVFDAQDWRQAGSGKSGAGAPRATTWRSFGGAAWARSVLERGTAVPLSETHPNSSK